MRKLKLPLTNDWQSFAEVRKWADALLVQLEKEEFFTLPRSGLVLYRGSRAPGGWFEVTDVLAPSGYIYIERGEEGIL